MGAEANRCVLRLPVTERNPEVLGAFRSLGLEGCAFFFYRLDLTAALHIEDAHVFEDRESATETLARLNDTWRDFAEIYSLTPPT